MSAVLSLRYAIMMRIKEETLSTFKEGILKVDHLRKRKIINT